MSIFSLPVNSDDNSKCLGNSSARDAQLLHEAWSPECNNLFFHNNKNIKKIICCKTSAWVTHTRAFRVAQHLLVSSSVVVNKSNTHENYHHPSTICPGLGRTEMVIVSSFAVISSRRDYRLSQPSISGGIVLISNLLTDVQSCFNYYHFRTRAGLVIINGKTCTERKKKSWK